VIARLTRLALVALTLLTIACSAPRARGPAAHLALLRAESGRSEFGRAGEWLLAELVMPGGTRQGVLSARARLALQPQGKARDALVDGLALGLDADVHGRLPEASGAYLATLEAARTSPRRDAPLVAWFAAVRLEALRPAVAGAWERAAPVVDAAIAEPGNLGWRARAVLVEWRARETYRRGGEGAGGRAFLAKLGAEQGCVEVATFAGPFGARQPGDHRRHHAAEGPVPWPRTFDADAKDATTRAEIAPATARGCGLRSNAHRGEGIHYVQTFLELDAPREIVIAVAGAYAVRVDDVEVLARDEGDWGSWLRSGVRLRLGAGRHRLVARLGRAETSIRVLGVEGTPAHVVASTDERVPYVLESPTVGLDPNPLEPFLRAAGVAPSAGAAHALEEDAFGLRYVAAALASSDGHRDVGGVLLAPLVEPRDATPVALARAAELVDGDPIFTAENGRTLARDLHARAAEGDPGLWASRLWLTLDRAAEARPADTARELEGLGAEFPLVPTIVAQLATIEDKLGWTVEASRTVRALAERFPEDVPTLEALVTVAERQGDAALVAKTMRTIAALDPWNELALRRALAREDFEEALAELRRIEGLRSDRPDLAARIAALVERSGGTPASRAAVLERLERALAEEPRDSATRLALADARTSAGEARALDAALVEAIRVGADTRPLHKAIELVEGATALEPYRKDGLAIIRETEAKGITLPGAAARVLDYAALWVAADGSARMLEHTILRMQSREGIARHTEQRLPRGVVLKLRTIKKDGRVLEPELVAGKPTATMPHLEIGDFIEIESLWLLEGDGEGRRFRSPRWFFREPGVSYHLSQFVVITPKHRPLTIETTGRVPEPELASSDGFEVRRYTVTGALALPEEPGAPPVEEFLPSVLVGWGADWMSQLSRVSAARAGGEPADPRLARIARTIAAGRLDGDLASVPHDERARRIYRWVVDNVTPGNERWPARIVTSKSGDLTEAFLFLCRVVGVDARLGVVKSRLAPPSRGPLSELEAYASTAVRVRTERGTRWLLVGSRFAPYGFLPSSLAGQHAVLVDPATRETGPTQAPLDEETTSTGGVEDGVVHRGKVLLAADGSARLELTEEFHGRYAIAVRSALSKVEAVGAGLEERRRELVEQRMVGPKLPGARVVSVTLPNLDDLDAPLTMGLVLEAPNLARRNDRGLQLDVPFLGSLGGLVALPTRETPLYVEESAKTLVELTVTLPKGARLVSTLETATLDDPRLRVHVADAWKGGVLRLEREADLPAGRVASEDYPAFRELVRRADQVLNQPVRIEL